MATMLIFALETVSKFSLWIVKVADLHVFTYLNYFIVQKPAVFWFELSAQSGKYLTFGLVTCIQLERLDLKIYHTILLNY